MSKNQLITLSERHHFDSFEQKDYLQITCTNNLKNKQVIQGKDEMIAIGNIFTI